MDCRVPWISAREEPDLNVWPESPTSIVTNVEHVVSTVIVTFAVLFPIVDPIGVLPPFVALTEHMEVRQRHREAALAALVAAAMLVVYLLMGHYVLSLFGVSLAAVEVVGGLIIGYTGWQMAVTRPIGIADHPPADVEDVYFYPLAFPLLAGPGALAVLLAMTNRYDSWLDFVGAVIGLVGVCIGAFLAMRSADPISNTIGPKGIEVVTRIMGLIALLIAAELIFHGIADHFGITLID